MKLQTGYRKCFCIRWLIIVSAVTIGCIMTTASRSNSYEEKTFRLTSDAFVRGGPIPAKYTCEGKDISPPLKWSGIPAQTRSLVLIMDDPDAPDPKAPKMTWVHWVLYNMPAQSASLPEGVTPESLPAQTKEGLNDWNRTGYGGPCPPVGTHRYFFKLYALDAVLEEMRHPTKERIEAAMRGHIIAKIELVGTYTKSR